MLGKGRLAVMTIFAVLVFAHAAWAEPTEIPDRPPPLTFDKHVDYVAWYNEFVRRGRDEGDNAYPLYLKLCPDKDGKGGFPKPEGKAAEQFEKAVGRVWTKEEFPELAEYLAKCEQSFELFEACTERRGYWEPAKPEDIILLQDGCVANKAGRPVILALSRWTRFDRQQSRAVSVRVLRVMLKFANQLEESPNVIDFLVGIATQSLAYDYILVSIADGILESRDYEKAIRLCQTIENRRKNWSRVMIAEWASCLNAYQYMFEKVGKDPDERAEFMRLLRERGSNESFEERLANGRLLSESIDQYYLQLVRIVGNRTPTPDRLRELRTFEGVLFKNGLASEPAYQFVRSLTRTYELALRTRVYRRGTMLALVLHTHYAKHGKWPKSLKAIDKKLGLKGIRKIVIDPYSDKPFIYKLKDGKPLLYSVGVDGKDDGGVHHAKFGDGATGSADFVFWPYQKPETK